MRLVVATTDPTVLPPLTTWVLAAHLPRPGSRHAHEAAVPPADLAEVVRLYGLRAWVEQGYKQLKHELGWADLQVRAGRAIGRHWTLVCCAFSFCWRAWFGESPPPPAPPDPSRATARGSAPLIARGRAEGKRSRWPRPAAAPSWPVDLRRVRSWLTPWSRLWRCWRAWSTGPPPAAVQELLTAVAAGRPLDLYAPG